VYRTKIIATSFYQSEYQRTFESAEIIKRDLATINEVTNLKITYSLTKLVRHVTWGYVLQLLTEGA
jgi:hypothetical protein